MLICIFHPWLYRGRRHLLLSSMQTQRRSVKPGECKKLCSSLHNSTSVLWLWSQDIHTSMRRQVQLCGPPYSCVAPQLEEMLHLLSLQLLQQQAGVTSLSTPQPGYGTSALGVASLLSPTSPTHGASPLSSGSSGTGLPSPSPLSMSTLSSFANGLPVMSPNGLEPSEQLQSPLNR